MQRSIVRGRHPPTPCPKVTVWSQTMMMKHGHIGKTKIVDDQQADSAQGLMQHQEIWKHGPPISCPHARLGTLPLLHQGEV